MREIISIAKNSFRETIRDKILYNILFFAVVVLILSYFISQWSVLAMSRVIKDFSLGTISIFGIVITLFLGINLIYKEVDRKTVYVIVSKPISRWSFVIGKFLGLSVTMFLNTILLTLASFVVFKIHGIEITSTYILAVFLIYVSYLVVLSLALFFSSFSSPFVSSVFTLIMIISGKLSYDIFLYAENMAKNNKMVMAKLLNIFYYIVPNLENFNIANRVAHNLSVEPSYVFGAIIYGVSYSLFFLILASIIFSKKELK